MRSDTREKLTSFGRWLAVVAIGSVLWSAPARAQSQQETKPVAAREVKIFYLKHASAKEVSRAVVSVLRDLALAVDERTNAVIAAGSKEELATAEAIISKLDDSRTTERPGKRDEPEAREMQLRVIWLANGLAPNDSENGGVPSDLRPVLEELEKIGVRDMQIVNQTVLHFLDRPFESEGSATLRVGNAQDSKELPCEFEISGASTGQYGERLQLAIRVKTQSPDPVNRGQTIKESLVAVKTEVTTPPGHFSVLGVSPSNKITSAFVVQVTPVNPARAQPTEERPRK